MGKVAVVTGAGSGIGRAVTIGLARADYSVVAVGRRDDPLVETARLAPDNTVLPVAADVSVPTQVPTIFAAARRSFGRVDLLFNNAGRGAPPVALEDLTHEQWAATVGTNLTGAFLCTQEAVRIMKSQNPMGGRIINNGSLSAQAPRPNSVAYTATKHALTGLTKSTSLECRKYNIACGQIDIGNAATDMTASISAGIEQPSGAVVAEPTIDVAEVVRAVLFMASLPLDVNVQFMTIMATTMPFVGRG